MPSDGDLEATELAQIEADLQELTTHVNRWIGERFLSSESAAGLSLEDISGLIAWLQQWHGHFDSYADTAATLNDQGRPAMQARLAQIRAEIDNSLASFTQMAQSLPEDREG